MNNKLMIVDCHSLGHSAKHATKRLSFGGRETGIIYGFLKKLLTLAETVKPDSLVFAWDSPSGTCIRKLIRPSYKASRGVVAMNEEEVMLQLIALRQFASLRDIILEALGFTNVFAFEGYEADDLIATITKENYNDEIVMVARDHDLHQLLTYNCSMLDHVSGAVMTKELFIKQWGIGPDRWAEVKAIAGCKTDEVEGIKGVGEKTAINVLLDKGAGVKHQRVKDNIDVVVDNLRLVHLPFDGQLFDKMRLKDNDATKGRFIEVCSEFGFKSMLNKRYIERWLSAFGQT